MSLHRQQLVSMFILSLELWYLVWDILSSCFIVYPLVEIRMLAKNLLIYLFSCNDSPDKFVSYHNDTLQWITLGHKYKLYIFISYFDKALIKLSWQSLTPGYHQLTTYRGGSEDTTKYLFSYLQILFLIPSQLPELDILCWDLWN